jgi:tRNA pseudouridine38-40 synthase
VTGRRALPEEIRLHHLLTVPKTFDARNNCDMRRYEYLLPAFALRPPAAAAGGAAGDTGAVPAEVLSARLEVLRRVLQAYQGTHNFHNFTAAKVKYNSPEASRYIISFTAGECFEVGGLQLVRCVVLGQSFMLHQIRKMVGLAVMVASGRAPDCIQQLAFTRAQVPTPMAPGLGLLLAETIFKHYNSRTAGSNNYYNNDHASISLAPVQAEVDAFKHDVLYRHTGGSSVASSAV